jgi:glutathione S-transferase
MKLYYAPGVCSLSPHIVLREAGYEFDLIRVDLKSKLTEHGHDYNAVSEKSYVPLLTLDSGETISEGVAIVQYLADQRPSTRLAPTNGTLARVRLQETLNFLSTEVHKSFFALFYPDTVGAEAVKVYRGKLAKAFGYLAERVAKAPFLMGDGFTVADAYAFTLLSWAVPTKLDLSPWPALQRYQERVGSRPKVREALRAEGLPS